MILQPFVENAFFHAFPSGRCGTIEIYMKEKAGELEIHIVDDGVGMEQNRAEEAVKQAGSKEHFQASVFIMCRNDWNCYTENNMECQ